MPRPNSLKDSDQPISDQNAVQRVFDLISSGMSIREACSQPGTPSEHAIYRKLAKDPEFEAAMMPYRIAQQHALMDRCVNLTELATPETTNLVRLRVDTIMKAAAKLAPKNYGDKQQIDVNITVGLADRLNAAIAKTNTPIIDAKPEPEPEIPHMTQWAKSILLK